MSDETPGRVLPGDLIGQLNEAAHAFFRRSLPGSWVPGYLTGRGLGEDLQQLWQTGYAPASWDALTLHLRAEGFCDSLIETAGLARRSRRGTLIDVFRDRAMLPIRSDNGRIIAFIGRAADPPGPRVPKYLNSPRTSLYDKSTELFGLAEAREALTAGAQPVIVEGPFDAIAVTTACHGRNAGVAPCGTALTIRQIRALAQIADLKATGVLGAFDADPAGRRAAVRAYYLLSQVTPRTSAAILAPGRDPAQILEEDGPGMLAATLASRTQPLADLVVDAVLEKWSRWTPYPPGQVNALHAAAAVIAAMPAAHVARQVARLADQLALDYATVTDAVTSVLPKVIRREAVATATRQRRKPRTAVAARMPVIGRHDS